MTEQQKKIGQFMRDAAKQPVRTLPTIATPEERELRIALIREELAEYEDACCRGDLIEIADALADLDYVVKGSFSTHGLDDEALFNEVHASNMTKVGSDISQSGKLLKGPDYRPPDIAKVLMTQLRAAAGRAPARDVVDVLSED